ncbi:MAG: hypothetical protein Q9212_004581 [Teloschistes hypoglaucus]
MMAQIPQATLNWLHNVLSIDYVHYQKTYSDVAQTLSNNPSLSPKTDVYSMTAQALLNFKPTAYHEQHLRMADRPSYSTSPEYPRTAPFTFVTPTKNMAVRAGQYVSVEGRVYHPYLAGWREDRSNLAALLSVLQEVFSREPPVISRQEQLERPQPMPSQSASIPPPIPPLPPELGRPESTSGRPISATQAHRPPPRPPKASDAHIQPSLPQVSEAPPVPPHPRLPQPDLARGREPTVNLPEQYASQSQRVNNFRSELGQSPDNRCQQLTAQTFNQQSTSPVSPLTPTVNQSFPDHTLQHQSYNQPLQGQPPPRPFRTHGTQQNAWQSHAPQLIPQPVSYQQYLHQQPPKPKPQEDLLTSPFENPLPAPAADSAPPPIPPNPHKDALLQALSQTLTGQVQSAHASNMSAIPPLRAQQAALNEALNKINQEISQLSDLEAMLDSNEKILRQSMRDADQVLEDAKRRDVPAVEEVLVAPTVVAGQLYENVIEERVLEETRAVVGRALDKGRIAGDVWAKQTRSLAREEFLKKALIKKIARGMGLVEEERWD